jgi:hypothetical protein
MDVAFDEELISTSLFCNHFRSLLSLHFVLTEQLI